MQQTHPLLPAIEAFLTRTGMSATTFGQKALGQWKLVERLRGGGSIGFKQEARLREFMRSDAARRVVPRRRRQEAANHV